MCFMKIYQVNTSITPIIRLYTLFWVLSLGFFVFFTVTRNPSWIYTLPGFAFLFLWNMLISTYPAKVALDDSRIGFSRAWSSHIWWAPCSSIGITKKHTWYEVKAESGGRTRSLRVQVLGLPESVRQAFTQIAGST